MSELSEKFPDVRTRRGLQNVAYRTRATRILKAAGITFQNLQPSTLTELGRIADEHFLLDVARLICAIPNLSSGDAVKIIRYNKTKVFLLDSLNGEKTIAEAWPNWKPSTKGKK
jgi:hypothetical protein